MKFFRRQPTPLELAVESTHKLMSIHRWYSRTAQAEIRDREGRLSFEVWVYFKPQEITRYEQRVGLITPDITAQVGPFPLRYVPEGSPK